MTAGQVAYEAYRDAAGGVSMISRAELPGWAGLRPGIQACWEAAGQAVLDAWPPA